MAANDRATSPIGLDVGTSRIVMARRATSDFQFQSQLNAFTTIPFSKMTQGVLKKESVPYTVENQDIVVFGNESEKFADLFHAETRRPMLNGIVNPDEPTGMELIRTIVEHLAGDNVTKGQRVYYSIPGAPLGSGEGFRYHEAAIGETLSELGYEVKSVNEGLAVIYSELEDTNYTGVGVSCGGGMCNVCLAYLSVPVVSFSLPKAGDFIDSSAATATGEVATRVRIIKEQSFQFNGSSGDRIQQALTVYYDEMIRALITGMEQAFSAAKVSLRLHKPVPMVLSGGAAMPNGFSERFEKALAETSFPLEISEVRLASSPLYSTAKGALVAALADM